jgi:hypothetical protein
LQFLYDRKQHHLPFPRNISPLAEGRWKLASPNYSQPKYTTPTISLMLFFSFLLLHITSNNFNNSKRLHILLGNQKALGTFFCMQIIQQLNSVYNNQKRNTVPRKISMFILIRGKKNP